MWRLSALVLCVVHGVRDEIVSADPPVLADKGAEVVFFVHGPWGQAAVAEIVGAGDLSRGPRRSQS